MSYMTMNYEALSKIAEHMKQRLYTSLDRKYNEIERLKKKLNDIQDEMKMLQEEYHRVSVL